MMLTCQRSHLHDKALLHSAESNAQAAFSILPVGTLLWWAFQPLPELLNGADHIVRQVRLAAALFVAQGGLLLIPICVVAAWPPQKAGPSRATPGPVKRFCQAA